MNRFKTFLEVRRLSAKEVPFTYSKKIGMWQLDRPMSTCLKYATENCMKSCYTNKTYTQYYKGVIPKDIDAEKYLKYLKPENFRSDLEMALDGLDRPTKVKRFRWCSRGEIFTSGTMISKVAAIAKLNPDIDFWAPTRAWYTPRNRVRQAELVKNIMSDPDLPARAREKWKFALDEMHRSYEEEDILLEGKLDGIRSIPNLFVLASIDDDADFGVEEWEKLKAGNWKIMYYGNDDLEDMPIDLNWIRCPATWAKKDGHCNFCKFCFTKKPINIHMKRHS